MAMKIRMDSQGNLISSADDAGFARNASGNVIGLIDGSTIIDIPNGVITPEKYNCVGNLVADDTVYFDAFLAATTGKYALLPGQYKITSLLNRGLSNCILQGIPGVTKIYGDFDYRVWHLAESQNVIFRDIEFVTEYVNAVEDPSYAVLYSYATSLKNIWFQRCKFTAPTCNTSGLSIYSNTLTTSTNTVNGFFVDDCDFVDIGRIGCTLMNRSEDATKYDLMKRVRFNGNLGKNLGLEGSYGFLVSLDGYGNRFSVDENTVENALGIGIENNGWCNGSISGNTFDKFDRTYSPIGTSAHYQYGVKINNNRCLSAASSRSYFIKMDDCELSENKFWYGSGTDEMAVHFEDVQNCRMTGNHYKNDNTTVGHFAAFYISRYGGCRRNISRDETFEGSSANYSLVRFDGQGSLCYDNTMYEPTFVRPAGVFYDEVNAAYGNLVIRGTQHINFANEDSFKTATFTTDADMTLTMANYSGEVTKVVNAALTAGRNVYLPNMHKVFTVINGTSYDLTFRLLSGGSTVVVAAGMTAIIQANRTNTIRLTADV